MYDWKYKFKLFAWGGCTVDGATREHQLEALARWLTDAVFEEDWDLNP